MPEHAVYEIHIEGHISQHWSDWFAGLTVAPQANGETVLRGPLADQAALHGVLMKIRDLHLVLVSVSRVEVK